RCIVLKKNTKAAPAAVTNQVNVVAIKAASTGSIPLKNFSKVSIFDFRCPNIRTSRESNDILLQIGLLQLNVYLCTQILEIHKKNGN
ncbi:MAG: hypothetical protein RI922_1, partial [Bacteroidota bacterium]